MNVKAVFVELPPFERYRSDYLDDDAFLKLQRELMLNPEAGDLIPGAGSLRKVRFGDDDKDEMSDLTKAQRQLLREMIKKELEARRHDEETSKTHAKT